MELHKEYATTWEVTLDQVKPFDATTAYISLLKEALDRDDLSTSLSAIVSMTPCMKLYSFLAIELKNDPQYESQGNP